MDGHVNIVIVIILDGKEVNCEIATVDKKGNLPYFLCLKLNNGIIQHPKNVALHVKCQIACHCL